MVWVYMKFTLSLLRTNGDVGLHQFAPPKHWPTIGGHYQCPWKPWFQNPRQRWDFQDLNIEAFQSLLTRRVFWILKSIRNLEGLCTHMFFKKAKVFVGCRKKNMLKMSIGEIFGDPCFSLGRITKLQSSRPQERIWRAHPLTPWSKVHG